MKSKSTAKKKKTQMDKSTKPVAEVRASYSEKKQIKQYEPIDISCSLTETCEPDKVEETYARLFLQCREFVKSRINAETPYESVVSKAEQKQQSMLDLESDEEAIGGLIGE